MALLLYMQTSAVRASACEFSLWRPPLWGCPLGILPMHVILEMWPSNGGFHCKSFHCVLPLPQLLLRRFHCSRDLFNGLVHCEVFHARDVHCVVFNLPSSMHIFILSSSLLAFVSGYIHCRVFNFAFSTIEMFNLGSSTKETLIWLSCWGLSAMEIGVSSLVLPLRKCRLWNHPPWVFHTRVVQYGVFHNEGVL